VNKKHYTPTTFQ